MHIKNKIKKTAAAVLSAAVAGLFGVSGYYSSRLPETITAESGQALTIAEYPEITCASFGDEAVAASETYPASRQATLTLFGAIPVKNVEVREEEAPTLIAGGNPFGIKLLMDGVMVTKLGKVEDENGNKVCPAEEAGVKVGDVIRYADTIAVTSNSELQTIIGGSCGRTVKLTINREGHEFTAYLRPVYSKEAREWRGGMWVRDSIAGIGTMTFVNKSTGEFAGLGHPICDSDTGETVPISSGEAVPVEITEAKKGETGIPGELRGKFCADGTLGMLNRNNSCGVFGTLTDEALAELCRSGEEYKMGYRQEVTTGKAYIFATISGEAPRKYEISIESIDYNGSESTKNMIIRITDKELLEATGGIVQGMSGSPIIQNDKLIGAVTHVFVADPTKGYAIFAENMAEYLCG